MVVLRGFRCWRRLHRGASHDRHDGGNAVAPSRQSRLAAFRERLVRRGLLVCGVLCLLGVVGPVVGNMRLQLVGVFAYGGVLPVVCLLVSRLFRSEGGPVIVRAA